MFNVCVQMFNDFNVCRFYIIYYGNIESNYIWFYLNIIFNINLFHDEITFLIALKGLKYFELGL